jgi:hypothetical protein
MLIMITGQTVDIGQVENGLAQPLLMDSVDKQNEDEDEEVDESEEAADDSRKPATSIGSAYRLLTPSVKVLGYCYAKWLLLLISYFTNLCSCLFESQ